MKRDSNHQPEAGHSQMPSHLPPAPGQVSQVDEIKYSSPKLLAPAPLNEVIETQLHAEMKNPEQRRAHWIHAGAGAGKTQGARLWLNGIDRPFAWIQLDVYDNDPVVFLAHLQEALIPLMQTPHPLPAFVPQGGLALERHCEYLWLDFFARLRRPSVLVLDDGHLIHDWAQHPVLSRIFQDLDARLHLVVISRKDLPNCFTRLVVNRELHEVGPRAFVWQDEHIARWLEKKWGIEEAPSQFIEELRESTGGWAAVLGLLDVPRLLQQPWGVDNKDIQQLEFVVLLERSLHEKLLPANRQVLRWLACMGSFPGEWLHSLHLPNQLHDQLLAWIQDSSLVIQLEQPSEQLRLHPVLIEILEGMPQRPLFEENRSIQRAMIRFCVDSGRALEALQICESNSDWQRYWELLQETGLAWLADSQYSLLQSALQALPDDLAPRFQSPCLYLLQAAASLQSDADKAYQLALRALKKSGRKPAQLRVWAMSLSTLVTTVIANGMSVRAFEPVLLEAREFWETSFIEDLPGDLRLHVLWSVLTASSMLASNNPSLEQIYPRIQAALEEQHELELEARILCALIRFSVVHGHGQHIDSLCAMARRLEARPNSRSATLALRYANLCRQLAFGHKAATLQMAQETLDSSAGDHIYIWQIETLAMLAYSAFSLNKLDRGRELLSHFQRLADKLSGGTHGLLTHLFIYSAVEQFHALDFAKALDYSQRAVAESDSFGYPLMYGLARLFEAAAKTELGRGEEAGKDLKAIERDFADTPIPLLQRSISFARASWSLRCASTEVAIHYTRLALAALRQSGFPIHAMDMLPANAKLLAFALEHDIESPFVHASIRNAPLYPVPRPHPKWPSCYEVQVLGHFDFHINGEPQRVRFTSRGRRFELLTALLWCGGRQVPLALLAGWIWNHINHPDRRIKAMQQSIKRLLQDLGREDALLQDESTLSLNPDLWSVDAWTLLHKLDSPSSCAVQSARFQLQRGFVGPTPIPEAMREVVPQCTAKFADLGPKDLYDALGPAPATANNGAPKED